MFLAFALLAENVMTLIDDSFQSETAFFTLVYLCEKMTVFQVFKCENVARKNKRKEQVSVLQRVLYSSF